jgi:hypothetical protein
LTRAPRFRRPFSNVLRSDAAATCDWRLRLRSDGDECESSTIKLPRHSAAVPARSIYGSHSNSMSSTCTLHLQRLRLSTGSSFNRASASASYVSAATRRLAISALAAAQHQRSCVSAATRRHAISTLASTQLFSSMYLSASRLNSGTSALHPPQQLQPQASTTTSATALPAYAAVA